MYTDDSNLVKRIFILSWPAMVDYLLQMVVQYADLFMVGTLGVEATAIVGFASQVNFMVKFPINSVAIGVTAYIAKAVGEKDNEKIINGSVQAFVFSIIVAVFATVFALIIAPLLPIMLDIADELRKGFLQYFYIAYGTIGFFSFVSVIGALFNGIGRMKITMYINVLVNVLNVIFNFWLIYPVRTVAFGNVEIKIFGAGMGLNGAALGTALSAVAGCGAMLLVYCKSKEVGILGQKITVDFAVIWRFVKVGLPAAAGSMITGLGRIVFTSFVSSLGVISVAAHTISYSLEGMFYIPAIGFQRATVTLAGVCLGERDRKKYVRLVKSSALISMSALLVMGVLLFLLAGYLTPLMTDSVQTADLSARMLRIIAFSEPLFALRIIMEGAFQGIGRTKLVFVADIFSMWFFRVFCCFILVKKLSMTLSAVWGCMIADNVFLALSLSTMFIFGSWKKSFD